MRLISLGISKNDVYITRILTKNSHDIYNDYKQINKAIIDLVTCFCLPEIRKLLVILLNKANQQVQKAHKSKHGLEILEGKLWVARLFLMFGVYFWLLV